MEKYDIVGIGDTVIDAFIKIQDASVHCNINHESCELCFRFGDKVPYESVNVLYAVGNSANASVSGARFGLNTALIMCSFLHDLKPTGQLCRGHPQCHQLAELFAIQITVQAD